MRAKTHELWNSRFLSQIINSMADGVFTMDTHGRITSWNDSMERITGYTDTEALGKTCDILQCSRCFDKDCPANHKACGILERGKAEDKECLVRHKGGHDVPVIKNARVVQDENGSIIGIVETLTNLTELKKARREAEEAMRRLGELYRFENIIGKSRAMQHVFVLCNQDLIDPLDLPLEIRQQEYSFRQPDLSSFPKQSSPFKMKLSRESLISILTECHWNKAEVGRRVGFSRTAIWKYMKKWNIPLKMPEDSPI